jgi:hypothetical protein
MPYWQANYFNQQTNVANVNTFAGVLLYNPNYPQGPNYENLFVTYDMVTLGTNPPSNSLFNL